MIQAYMLYFDTDTTKLKAEVIKMRNETSDELDRELKHHLVSDGYEFLDYSSEIAVIVDDRGFEKTLNPVFELTCEYGDTHRLAGRLIFVRNIENEDSVDVGSITYEDIFHFRTGMVIKLLGVTKEK
ncbi:hypothetical protein BA724_13915 [Domibacillus iocasae]|uniref:Uncharacterized protein n=2 Tax=Domibacillus iocasae TaxID=1714016 RepID=A0A1E7DJT0_9BACI|nr:hypothetical protein BA724_13915 [Domibacillus iocasae]